jgi:hypothetical protein
MNRGLFETYLFSLPEFALCFVQLATMVWYLGFDTTIDFTFACSASIELPNQTLVFYFNFRFNYISPIRGLLPKYRCIEHFIVKVISTRKYRYSPVFADNVDSQYVTPFTCTNVNEVYICSNVGLIHLTWDRSSGDHSTETSGSVHDELHNEQLFLEKWIVVFLDFTTNNRVVAYQS